MEGNFPGGSMICSPLGMGEVQGSLNSHYHNQHLHPFHQNPQQHQRGVGHHPQPLEAVLPLASAGNLDHGPPPAPDFGSRVRNSSSGVKMCGSDEDEPSFNEDGIDGHVDDGKGKKGSPWHRMKWTDDMVRLLISILAYIGEDTASDCNGGRKKLAILHKKGKWKSVSKVMASRGCYVSPQQCEDKFNDLNKRYKRLTDVLGRGTSCAVVENPALLDTIGHLSEKSKEDVRKILGSKHLFYEEMCSYHNGNRLHLLDEPSLLQCLQSVLRSSTGMDVEKSSRDNHGCEDGEEEDESENVEEDMFHGAEDGWLLHKRPKIQNNVTHETLWQMPPNAHHEFSDQVRTENIALDVTQMPTDQPWAQKEWVRVRMLQLQEQKIRIETQALQLEAQRFKWQRFCRKKEREMDKLKLENERMKLENERYLLELRRKELELGLGRSTASIPGIVPCFGHLPQGGEQNDI